MRKVRSWLCGFAQSMALRLALHKVAIDTWRNLGRNKLAIDLLPISIHIATELLLANGGVQLSI